MATAATMTKTKMSKPGVLKSKIFLGPAGIPAGCKVGSTLDGIRYVHEIGLDAMEVEFVRGVHMGAAMAKDCGEAAGKLGVKLSVHAPYFINLSSAEAEKITASQKRILDSVERAHEMGAYVVVIHPGHYGKFKQDTVFDMAKEALGEIIEKMKERRIADVRLGLETTGKHSAFGTLDEIVQLCRQLRQCAPVIDFAHIYARNGGKIDYGKIFDTVKPLKLKHLHTHFSNIEFTKAGERMHFVLDSSPAFEPLAREVLKRKMDITIVSESPVLEQDSLKMKRIFEKLGHKF